MPYLEVTLHCTFVCAWTYVCVNIYIYIYYTLMVIYKYIHRTVLAFLPSSTLHISLPDSVYTCFCLLFIYFILLDHSSSLFIFFTPPFLHSPSPLSLYSLFSFSQSRLPSSFRSFSSISLQPFSLTSILASLIHAFHAISFIFCYSPLLPLPSGFPNHLL